MNSTPIQRYLSERLNYSLFPKENLPKFQNTGFQTNEGRYSIIFVEHYLKSDEEGGFLLLTSSWYEILDPDDGDIPLMFQKEEVVDLLIKLDLEGGFTYSPVQDFDEEYDFENGGYKMRPLNHKEIEELEELIKLRLDSLYPI